MIRNFVIISILLASPLASASNSLTWQKLALEEKVQRKYNSALSTVLKDNQYLVEVEVDVNDPGGPNFGDDAKSGVRVSDISLSESRGDYIAFSKVGLEVPVVDKFFDEDRTKLMNLYRFNEAYDLFKNITTLNVTVYFSDKVQAPLLEIAKKLLSSSKLSVAGVKPSIKFETIAMEWVDPTLAKEQEKPKKPEVEKKPEEKEPKIWAKDWYEWASRWGNAVGLILGSLILGIMALALFKQWKAFMEKYAQAMAPKEQEEKKEDQKTDEGSSLLNPAPSFNQEDDMATAHGYERFRQCLEQHPDEALTMVKSWLNDAQEMSLLSLRGLAQMCSPEEMATLLGGLSVQQRDKWKSLLGHHLEPKDLLAANKHIFQEVVKSLLVPTMIKDGELLNLIMELDTKSTCEFMKEHTDQVGIMMNILGPTVVAKILSEVDDKHADSWLAAGSEIEVEAMEAMEAALPKLKAALTSFKQSTAPSPFAQRILSMISSASPSRESALFRALAKSGTPSMILDAARKHFPSDLILRLPKPFLKDVLQAFPMNKRIELIQSRNEDVRKMLIETIAEPGSPARDLLEMELQNIAQDPDKQASIKARSEELWTEFVRLSRVSLDKTPVYREAGDHLISDWGQKLGSALHVVNDEEAA